MGRYRVLPYKQGSRSAKALADALGGKVLKLEGSTFVWQPGDVVINWGNSSPPAAWTLYQFNGLPLEPITNKLKFFELMQEKCPDVIPAFWTDKDEIPDDAFPVVCRTVLCGHSGAGVVIAPDRDSLVDAPLYTQYVKKKDEYRVHCGKRDWVFDADPGTGPEYKTDVISLQRKARRLGHDNPNWQVRNHANGFVYVRDQVNPPDCVRDVAVKAFEASGLDFGAVDVIYNDKKDRAFVLEINSAPGLEGQTVQDYANFFKEL